MKSSETPDLLKRCLFQGFLLAALGKRLSSVRKTLIREKKEKKSSRVIPPVPVTPARRVEEMYSKPNKHSLPVLPDSSLVIVTHKTINMVRKARDDDTKSYMSVHVQKSPARERPEPGGRWRPQCSCDTLQLKKYSVMLGLVSTLVILLTVGLYFMSGNVVTVTPQSRGSARNYIYETVDRSTTWKDFDQVMRWITESDNTRYYTLTFISHISLTSPLLPRSTGAQPPPDLSDQSPRHPPPRPPSGGPSRSPPRASAGPAGRDGASVRGTPASRGRPSPGPGSVWTRPGWTPT